MRSGLLAWSQYSQKCTFRNNIIKLKNKIMKQSIQLSDFNFSFSGYGHYKVTYTSPKTGKQWTCKTDNMQLIDATKNADNPLKKDLIHLKNICKE